MMHKINLVVGDWSGDGHDKRETTCIESNLSLEELKKAYEKGTQILGFDLIKDVCAYYEDYHIRGDYYETLITELKKVERFNSDIWSEDANCEEDVWIDAAEWSDYVLAVCTIGNPELKWSEASNQTWNIGGYGLFL